MASYRVVAPMVGLKVRDANGAVVILSFYAGSVVSDVDPASLEHHLAKGMVELVDDPQPEPDSEPGPADGKVKDILTEVGDDKDKAAAALAAELAKGDDARSTLVEKLQAVLDA